MYVNNVKTSVSVLGCVSLPGEGPYLTHGTFALLLRLCGWKLEAVKPREGLLFAGRQGTSTVTLDV